MKIVRINLKRPGGDGRNRFQEAQRPHGKILAFLNLNETPALWVQAESAETFKTSFGFIPDGETVPSDGMYVATVGFAFGKVYHVFEQPQ